MFLHTSTNRVMREEQNWLGGKPGLCRRHLAFGPQGRAVRGLNTEGAEEAKDTNSATAWFVCSSVTFVSFVFNRF